MALSRRTFDEQKRYDTVVVKENTHPADFEIVELQDIQNAEREGFLREFVTDGFFGDGFLVIGSGMSNAVKVTPGTGLSLGRRLILPDSTHGLIAGEHVFNMQIATPVTNRTDLIYADIFRETVTSSVDPVIEDPSLGPTADRERVRYIFRVSEGSTTIPTLPAGHVGIRIALVTRRANDPAINAEDVVDVRPLIALHPQMRPQNLIIVSPEGGDFDDPQKALDSISGASASNPFTILVRPGVYELKSRLIFLHPHVSMIGVGPNQSKIVIDEEVGGSVGCDISADRVQIKNLGITFKVGNVFAHGAAIRVTAAFSVDLQDLVLGEDYFNENDTNVLNGLNFSNGGDIRVRNCRIFSQRPAVEAISIGGGANVVLENCDIVAADQNLINVTSGSTLTMVDCTALTNRTALTSSGTVSISDCRFRQETVKTFVVSAAYLALSASVTNRVSNTDFDGVVTDTGDSTSIDTSMIWNNVKLKGRFSISGGGASQFSNCEFNGLDINGSAADIVGCEFRGPPSAWAVAGVGTDLHAVILRNATQARVIGCRTPRVMNFPTFAITGANPLIKDCHMVSNVDGLRVVQIFLTSNPVFDNCILELKVAYTTAGAFRIGDTASEPTVVHCHFISQSPGTAFFINGVSSGTRLKKGQNTAVLASGGSLFDATTVTVITNLEVGT